MTKKQPKPTNPPNEKPIAIPLDFEEALKAFLSIPKPPMPNLPKGNQADKEKSPK